MLSISRLIRKKSSDRYGCVWTLPFQGREAERERHFRLPGRRGSARRPRCIGWSISVRGRWPGRAQNPTLHTVCALVSIPAGLVFTCVKVIFAVSNPAHRRTSDPILTRILSRPFGRFGHSPYLQSRAQKLEAMVVWGA